MIDRGDESETGNAGLKSAYEEAITKAAMLLPFSREAARLYAEIRRDRSIRPPDAIQLACAAHARVDLFITNDDRLAAKTVSGIHFIQSIERAFL